MLGKNRIIFPGEKVLLAVSGGPSSCAMLNQVQKGLSENAHKKLRFKPGIVYIDEGCVLGHSLEERQKTAAQIQSLFERAGFPYHIIPLEMVLNLPSSVLEPVFVATNKPTGNYKVAVDNFIQTNPGHALDPTTRVDQSEVKPVTGGPVSPLIDETQTQRLQEMFSKVKTLTAKEDLLHMLRYGDIVAVRPMRDYAAKEISLYNYMWNVPCVFIPGLETKTADKSSIQRLTESFVVKLQTDFPSTVLNLPSSVLEPVLVATNEPTGNYKVAVDNFIQTNPGHALDPTTRVDQSEVKPVTGGPVSPLIDETQTQRLQEMFSKVKTLTAKEDLLHMLRRHLLVWTARAEGYSKLMLGENCTRLAVKLLANIALGRGAQLAVDTAFSDPRYGDIVAVRPMRDYAAKEISLYNYMWNVPCVFTPGLETKTADKSSIQRLTESFVVKLQTDFPSTTSVEFLPQYIMTEAQRRTRRSQMRNEISDFLLNEDQD
ncbi:hypothetical protein CRUP_003868 [Coryphaenoides rupestris]|nr:hypothetical protein CRUP_003868 [Coryphaenoides rupestris]